MLYQTVDFNTFKNAFIKAGRGDRYSKNGLKMLYDWLVSDSQYFELDVFTLCCQFDEYSIDEFLIVFQLERVMTAEGLRQSLKANEIDCVITYDIDKDIIMVNSDWC